MIKAYAVGHAFIFFISSLTLKSRNKFKGTLLKCILFLVPWVSHVYSKGFPHCNGHCCKTCNKTTFLYLLLSVIHGNEYSAFQLYILSYLYLYCIYHFIICSGKPYWRYTLAPYLRRGRNYLWRKQALIGQEFCCLVGGCCSTDPLKCRCCQQASFTKMFLLPV